MKYLVIIEKTTTGYSAYTPDILGCVATGSTRKEVEQSMREAVQFHLEGLRLENFEIPPSFSRAAYINIQT
jgi:predicted RNase H-like HicB family nuclease